MRQYASLKLSKRKRLYIRVQFFVVNLHMYFIPYVFLAYTQGILIISSVNFRRFSSISMDERNLLFVEVSFI